jgi:hypothetical protein
MNLKPYIGITDFTSREQVREMLRVFRQHRKPSSDRILHIGVMMSYKTLNNIECKWSKVFPSNRAIADIFEKIEGEEDLYFCLHYADYSGNTTIDDLVQGIKYAGPCVNAIQLDMLWPDPGLIARAVNMSCRNMEVILQIGEKSFESCNNNPDEVDLRLEDYKSVVHRLLLDRSMGQGHPMDANGLIPFAQVLSNKFPEMGIVVAGGLGPESIGLVEPIARIFPDISIDAQGKLRSSGSVLDPIDWDMASTYLRKALNLLN